MPIPNYGEVLFMRHPETVQNVAVRLSGQVDADLSEKGKAQLERAIKAVLAWEPDRIYCSPLKRTHAIADPVAEKLGCEVITDERINEIAFGQLEGACLLDNPEDPIFPWKFDEEGHSLPLLDAESYESVTERAASFVQDIVGLPGKTLCVTHGGLIRGIYAAVYNIPTKLAWNHVVLNVSSHIFLSDGKYLHESASGLTPEEVLRRSKDA